MSDEPIEIDGIIGEEITFRLPNDRIAELERKITELEEGARRAAERLQEAVAQRDNLLRINRERANAARGLRPKKEHTGYAVLSSDEKWGRIPSRWGSEAKDRLYWETRIQTPYGIEQGEAQVRALIEEELLAQKGLVTRLGVRGIAKGEELMQLSPEEKKALLLPNRVIDHFLRADYRAGYWEAVLRHDKPLSAVPEEMLPKKREKKGK